MAYITRIKNWTAEKLYAADLNAEVNNIISGTSDGSKDVAIAKLGVGTTTLTYLANFTTATIARAVSIAQTYATGTNYGLYVSSNAAATALYGIYASCTGATSNYGVYSAVVGAGTNNYGIYSAVTGAITSAYAIYSSNASTGAVEYGVYSLVSGASATSNTALYGKASGSAGLNYDLYCGGADDASYAKLPYWTGIPAGAVANGTITVVTDGGLFYLCARAGGAWKKVAIA